MKKVLLSIIFLLLNAVGIANPQFDLASQEMTPLEQQEVKSNNTSDVKVGDTIKVKTAKGWRLAKVAKVAAAGLLFATLSQGAEAGPICWTGVILVCGTYAASCALATGPFSPACIAAMGPECLAAIGACAPLP